MINASLTPVKSTWLCSIDFAENFTYGEQDAIQSFHWSNNQITLFTAYVWAGDREQSFIICSDYMNHDKHATGIMLEKVIRMMATASTKTVSVFSDGAAKHFKQKYNLCFVSHIGEKLGVTIDWCFFATSHGKGVIDGIGGTAKRLAHAATMRGTQIKDSKTFVAVVGARMEKCCILLIEKDTIEKSISHYNDVVTDVISLVG